jgi:hypothetical protein
MIQFRVEFFSGVCFGDIDAYAAKKSRVNRTSSEEVLSPERDDNKRPTVTISRDSESEDELLRPPTPPQPLPDFSEMLSSVIKGDLKACSFTRSFHSSSIMKFVMSTVLSIACNAG